MWTLLGAVLILGERPSALEGVGIAITLASFVGLSFAGQREGIHFHRDKWFGFLLAGTLLGALSGLYDKFLLSRAGFSAATGAGAALAAHHGEAPRLLDRILAARAGRRSSRRPRRRAEPRTLRRARHP